MWRSGIKQLPISWPWPLPLLCVKHLTLHAPSQAVVPCYFNMVEPQMASMWMSNTSTVSSDQWFYLLLRCNGLSAGLQPENIISVLHNIISPSIRLFVIFKSLCTSPWWWVSSNGSPAGHLTPVRLHYLSVVWSKRAPPMGFVTSASPSPPTPAHHSGVVVSCGEEGVEGPTAAGLFRQDSSGVRNRDACQLCKARLSPCIS